MSNEIQVNKKSGLNMFDTLMLISFSYNSVLVFFSAFFSRLPVINSVGYLILPIGVSFFTILCFMAGYFKKVKAVDLLFIALFVGTILISYVLHPSTQDYYTQSNWRLIYVEVVPYFLLGLCFRCNQDTLKRLTYISYIAIVINSFYMFFYVGLNSQEGDYYMGQAYIILPHILFTISGFFDRDIIKSRIASLSFLLIGFFYLVAMGSRGPLLIATIYLVVKMFSTIDRKDLKKMFVFILFAMFLLFFVATGYYLVLIEWFSNVLSRFGMSTRILDLLQGNEYFSNTSGRDKIYKLLLKKISEKPLLGYGVFGEEQFGVLAHNIALEIIMYYGIPVGVTVIIAYLSIALKAFFKSENKYAKEIILLFFVMTVARAPFGGSYLSYYFFFLLGLSISVLRSIKQKV